MANVEPNDRRRPEVDVGLTALNTFTPLFISSIIANKLYSGTEFSLEAWLLMPMMVAAVLRAGKIVNASYDYGGGEVDGRDDNDRQPDRRTDNQVKWLSALLYLFSCVTFFWLVAISPAKTSRRLALYLLVLSTSFLHSSGFNQKYLGFGDMMFLVFVHTSYLFGCISPRNQPDFFIFYIIPCVLKIEAIIKNHYANNLENDQGWGIRLVEQIINQTLLYSLLYVSSTFFSNQLLLLLLIKIFYAIIIEKELKSCVDINKMFRLRSKLNFIFGTLFELVILVVIKLSDLDN